MNIIINTIKLARAIRIVERIVARNVSLPILNTILLKTEMGNLVLSATNLEIGIKTHVGAKIEKEGSVSVPAHVFSELMASISDEKLTLSADKNIIHVVSEHFKTSILGARPDEFPILPSVKNGTVFRMAAADLAMGLSSVVDAASLLETRPELSGIYVHTADKRIFFAATDSFRLSEKNISFTGPVIKPFIMPRPTALEITRLCEDAGGDVDIVASESQLSVKGPEFELVSRLIDGKYPEYKRVIPEKFSSVATVERAELEKNIRAASIFSSAISDLAMSVDGTRLRIVAKNSDRGDFASHIAAQVKNGPFDVSVNYKYLLDGLKVVSTPKVLLCFSGAGSPLVLRCDGNTDFTYVIMPLRTS